MVRLRYSILKKKMSKIKRVSGFTRSMTVLKGMVLVFVCFCALACSQNKTPLTSKSPEDYLSLVAEHYSGALAYQTTDFVSQYWRVAGNTGFNATVEKITASLDQAGYIDEAVAKADARFTYRIEKREMNRPTWEPIDAELSILGEDTPLLRFKTNRNMIYQYASSTPDQGITAAVVAITDVTQLTTENVSGKIVFAEMSPYRIFDTAIEKAGALGVLTYNNPDYLQPEKNVTSIQFRGMRYKKDRPAWGMALSYQAKERLKQALAKGEVVVNARVETKIYPSEELTVVATVKGASLPKESLVFSAHIQEPGANDNASGVGAQLEMAVVTAQLIKDKQLQLDRTLTFLWGDEIISTRRYIQEKERRSTAINWGISLDMVGENTALTGGSFLIEKMPDPSAIWTRGKDKHSEWGGQVLTIDDMRPHYLNDFIIDVFKQQGARTGWEVKTNPFEGGSDHTPFLKADIPGLLLWHFTDQFYHTDNDRIDKVSQTTLKNVGTAALASAYTLLNADTETAKRMISLLGTAAAQRLEAEFLLGQQEIIKGASEASQVQILKTWADWYIAAIQSVADLSFKDDKPLEVAIDNAVLEVKNATNQWVEQLKVKP